MRTWAIGLRQSRQRLREVAVAVHAAAHMDETLAAADLRAATAAIALDEVRTGNRRAQFIVGFGAGVVSARVVDLLGERLRQINAVERDEVVVGRDQHRGQAQPIMRRAR